MYYISILKAENPFCLWGRIVKGPGIEPESPKAYEDLQVKMNLFYHEVNQDVQKIKPSSIHEGQMCVVYVSSLKNWCRAVVESLFLGAVGSQALCFLVDHGEHTVVCSDEVRAPLEKFLQLPFWVRKFQLAGIQPVRLQVSICEEKAELVPSNQWDSSATRYLHNLLQASNQMEAVVRETQADSTFIELYLTIRNIKICVNDDLVTKRFACFPSWKSHSPAQNGVVDRSPAILTCDIYSDTESFLATNGCTIRSLSPLVSPRHPAVTKVTNQRPVITSGQVALQTSNGASQGQGKVRKLSEGGGINQKEAHHPELDSDEGHHGLREDTQDTETSLVADLLKNLNRVRFLTFLNPASSAQRPVPNTDLEEENEEDDVHGISGAKDEEELVGATQQTVDETAGCNGGGETDDPIEQQGTEPSTPSDPPGALTQEAFAEQPTFEDELACARLLQLLNPDPLMPDPLNPDVDSSDVTVKEWISAVQPPCENGNLMEGKQVINVEKAFAEDSVKSFHPQIKWFQRDDRVVLRVLLLNSVEQRCEFSSERVVFSATVNERPYRADLELHGPIAAESCSWEVKCNEPVIQLMKKDRGDWKMLLKQKSSFVSLDFDHFEDNEEEILNGRLFFEEIGRGEDFYVRSESGSESD